MAAVAIPPSSRRTESDKDVTDTVSPACHFMPAAGHHVADAFLMLGKVLRMHWEYKVVTDTVRAALPVPTGVMLHDAGSMLMLGNNFLTHCK